MFDFFILSQLLATVTLVTECFAMQLKNKQHLLALLSVSCLFNSLHFFLLEQPTAGYILLFSSIRFLISIRWKSQWIAVASLFISLIITIYSYIGFLSILGFVGTIFITVGSFSKNDKTLRIMMMLGSFIWLSHNIILWTPMGILLEALFISSGMIGFYLHYIAPKAQQFPQSQPKLIT